MTKEKYSSFLAIMPIFVLVSRILFQMMRVVSCVFRLLRSRRKKKESDCRFLPAFRTAFVCNASSRAITTGSWMIYLVDAAEQ